MNNGSPELSEAMQDDVMLLFWEKGYLDTSIHDLAQVTQLKRSTLYKYFGGKQGLFEQMLKRFRGKVVVQAVATLADPATSMQGIIQFFKQFLACNRDMITSPGCLMIAIAASLPQDIPEAKQVLDEFIQYLRALFYKNLRQQQSEKQIDHDIDIEMLADYFVGNVVGMITLLRAADDARILMNHVQGVLFFTNSLIRKHSHATLHVIS